MATKHRLLEAATRVAGGISELASRLGISELTLEKYLTDPERMPDALVLATIDLILAESESRLPRAR